MLSPSAMFSMGWMKIPTCARAIRNFILLLTLSSIIMCKVNASEDEKDQNPTDRSSKRIDVIMTLVLANFFPKPVLLVLCSYLDVVPHTLTFGPPDTIIASPCVSRDSRFLAHITPGTNTATIWTLETGTIWCTIVDPTVREFHACALADINHWLVTSGTDGTIKRWSTENGGLLQTITPAAVLTDTILLVCPTGRWIYSGSEERIRRLWDVTTGELHYIDHTYNTISTREYANIFLAFASQYILEIKHKPHQLIFFGDISVFAFSHDHTYYLMGMRAAFTLVVHNNETGGRQWFRGHTSIIECCCMSTNQRWVLSGDQTGTLKLWSMAEETCVGTIVDDRDHSEILACYFWMADQYIIAVRSFGAIRIWELRGLLQQFQHKITN